MEHHLLLTAVSLHLDPEVRSGKAINGIFTVKNPVAHSYLRITKADWSVIEQFARPTKVPDALKRMLEERTCPPLRDFYEVVLKAHRAKILRDEPVSAPPAQAVRWFGVGKGWPVKLSVLVNLVLVGLVFLPGWAPSFVPLDLLKGWALVCGALSLGQMLAAAVVTGADGRVYRPRLAWRTWTPHLAFDLRDANLGTREQQFAAIVVQFLPTALTAAVTMAAMPAWSLPAIVGWLWQLRPVMDGQIVRALEVYFQRLRPDTKRDYLFEANRGLYARRKAAVRSTAPRVAASSLIFGVAWVALVVAFTLKATGLWPASWWFEREWWIQTGSVFGVWMAAVVVLLVGAEVAWWCWRRWKVIRNLMRLWQRRQKFEPADVIDPRTIGAHLLQSSLYRRLTPEQQHEVAQRLEIREVSAGTRLFDFDDTPAFVGLILSGEVKQHRRGPTGHLEKVGPLAEYEVFGAHRVADPKRRVRARARTRLCFLSLSMADFMECVVTRIGVQPVEQSAVRQPFLRRISLCAHWHPQALARFVQLTTSVDCHEGDLIIRKGEDTLDLFFVQEGRVEVVLGKRRRRVLRAGAFFGEIGLLQNSRVVADVNARTTARCIAINKREFLRFLTHNPSVGLQVERISSERLGRAIFPLSRQSFDIR